MIYKIGHKVLSSPFLDIAPNGLSIFGISKTVSQIACAFLIYSQNVSRLPFIIAGLGFMELIFSTRHLCSSTKWLFGSRVIKALVRTSSLIAILIAASSIPWKLGLFVAFFGIFKTAVWLSNSFILHKVRSPFGKNTYTVFLTHIFTFITLLISCYFWKNVRLS